MMRNLRKVFVGVVASLTGLSFAHAEDGRKASEAISKINQKWAEAEREVCEAVIRYSNIEDMSAQELYDYQLLLDLISVVSDEPIEYCEALLMENMEFMVPTQ